MSPELENLLRKLYASQLDVLKILSEDENGVSSNKEIGDTTSTPVYQLGALIAPLRRHKINGEPLIVPAGRDYDGGSRWQINEKLVDRKVLKNFLSGIGISYDRNNRN